MEPSTSPACEEHRCARCNTERWNTEDGWAWVDETTLLCPDHLREERWAQDNDANWYQCEDDKHNVDEHCSCGWRARCAECDDFAVGNYGENLTPLCADCRDDFYEETYGVMRCLACGAEWVEDETGDVVHGVECGHV